MIKETKSDKNNFSKTYQHSNQLQFLKVNRENSLNFFDEDSLIKLKLSLYTTLASIEEEIIGREINKLFDRIIPNLNDQFKVNLQLAKEYFEKHYFNSPRDHSGAKLLEDVKSSLDSIINKNYNMEFSFYQTYLEELCKVLVYSYLELSNKDYFSSTSNKNYKINTYGEFIKAVDNLVDRNVDVIKRYRDRDRDSRMEIVMSKNKQSICSNSTRSSISSGSTYTYQHSNNANEFEIPNEMIILLNKFQTIKTLKMFVPTKVEDLLPFIIILLNIEWIFPNLFAVEMDFSMGPLHRELNYNFLKGINNTNTDDNPINNNILARKSIARKSFMNKSTSEITYQDSIKTYKLNFELIVIYSFFVSKMEKIKILNLVFPESFQNETLEALKLSDVYLINFQFFNFYTPITNLYQLSVDFNSLESPSFEKVLSLFHKNNHLRSFKISLFTNESHYSVEALTKLCSVLNLNISQFFTKKKSFTNSVYEANEFNSDVEDFILTKLLDTYEENLEKFFFIFQTKLNLFEFHLKADLPRVVSGNENYISTFHKFIFNFFSLLNNETSSLQTLKLNLPYLSFDNRKYPGICKFFDMIDLKYKQILMYNFTISLQFNKVYNVCNIISTNLKYLHIGELDLDTFKSFINYFGTDQEYRKKSKLTCLEISLSKIIFDQKRVMNEIKDFLSFNRPNNLREFSLFSNLILNKEDFINLYKMIYNDRIEKYTFLFNNRSSIDYFTLTNKRSLPEVFYRVENKKLNVKIVKVLYKLSSKFHNKKFMDHKLFCNMQKYLEHYEKKTVEITFH